MFYKRSVSVSLFTFLFFILVGNSSAYAQTGACIDTDGDGWGWTGTESCLVDGSEVVRECIDVDGDGWGWDGQESCFLGNIIEPEDPPEPVPPVVGCLDPDGDGFGWDGEQTCIPDGSTVNQFECIDTDGDGWGWNGRDSCLVGEDTTPPVITLNGDNPLELTVGEPFIDSGATALDDIDGDLTDAIFVGGDFVDTDTPSTYQITYTAVDSAGNSASITRIIVIASQESPPVDLGITLVPAIEEAFGADPSNEDTDGDGLLDVFEIVYGYPSIAPDASDSDGDGTTDDQEDSDGDGLNNLREQEHATDPQSDDTDRDGLSDLAELDVHGTDPLVEDTDGDGISDGRELELGLNPLTNDADQQVTSTEVIGVIDINTGEKKDITITIVGDGDIAKDVSISTIDAFVAPGKVGDLYEIDLSSGFSPGQFQSAEISIPYDPTDPNASDPTQLAIFTTDPTTGFWQALPSSTDTTNNMVTATTTHFSPFFVAEQNTFQASLDNLPETCKATDIAAPTDVVLVIDSSGSMGSNDPGRLRVTASETFINAKKPTDEIGVITFSSGSQVLSDLTMDASLLINSLQGIGAFGGTNITSGVTSALSLLSAGTGTAQAIILLTDGEGIYDANLTTQMAASGIRAFTIALGTQADEALLERIAEGTQGGFKQIQDASSLVGIFDEFSTVFGDDGTDSDGDGLTDCQEVQGIYVTSLGRIVKTDPNNEDSDGDGILDGLELGLPIEVVSQANTPFESPGISDPNKADSDGDLIPDPEEHLNLTNPLSGDSDGDGLSDYAEIVLHSSLPYQRDTDGDGLTDNEEIARSDEGFDPAIFDYENTLFNRISYFAGFGKGFIVGDFADIDTFPELSGQIISSFIPLVDARDVIANLTKSDYVGVSLSGIGLVPFAGDGLSAAGKVAKYLSRFPNQRAAVESLLRKLPGGDDIVKLLPGVVGKTGEWLNPNVFKRGRNLEIKLGQLLPPQQKMFGNFPQFDTWDEASGIATSIKTIDLNAKTYQTKSGFRGILTRSIESLEEAIPGGLRGKDIEGLDVFIPASLPLEKRNLVIGVPRTPFEFQQEVLDEFVKQGKNITIEIID